LPLSVTPIDLEQAGYQKLYILYRHKSSIFANFTNMAKSAVSKIVPLVILFLVLVILAAVGFVAYQIANDVSDKTRKKMEKRNISFTKEGMKVGVKEKSAEQQTDSAQSMIVKIWNNSYFPAYKSRLGWMDGPASNRSSPAGTPATTPGTGTEKRKPFSRSSSSQTNVTRTTTAQSLH